MYELDALFLFFFLYLSMFVFVFLDFGKMIYARCIVQGVAYT